MSEINTIRLRQIEQSELYSYITGVVNAGFSNFVTQYLSQAGNFGPSILYVTGGIQTISGDKTFALSPNVPYSGQTGQVTSRKYIDDQITTLSSILTPIQDSQYVHATGTESIYGIKSFFGNYVAAKYLAKTSGDNTAYGINLDNSSLVGVGGANTLKWDTKFLYGAWTFDTIPTIAGGSAVVTVGDQVIFGKKTFSGEVEVQTAVNSSNPVPYAQFKQDLANTNQSLESLIISSITGNSSGIAGVASFNGTRDNIFTQGRGTVTVWQQGNICNISGAQISNTEVSSLFITRQISLDTGFSQYRINFPTGYSQAPMLFVQLGNNVSSSTYAYQLSGVNTSGFGIGFSEIISETGCFLNYLAIEQTGMIGLFKGEQGLLGPSVTPKGDWATGLRYSYLDFVTNPNGVSWICKSGHVSSVNYNPTGISGSNYWNLLASGQGPKGVDAFGFAYRGVWDSSTIYSSGDAVTFSGSSYGTTGTLPANYSPSTGSLWITIASKGDSGSSFLYKGAFNTGTPYGQGDVVSLNSRNYTLTGKFAQSSGLRHNPNSYFAEWVPISERQLTFRGAYSATNFHNKNDIVYLNSGYGVSQVTQYLNNSNEVVKGLHPNGYYNSFLDCSGIVGYNLFQLNLVTKNTYNPNIGIGSTQDFSINLQQPNDEGSGFYKLKLIEGEVYYFDSEILNTPFIIAESNGGGNYISQYTTNITTGKKLLVGSSYYDAMGYGQSFSSGTMRFAPNSGTPRKLYLVSPISGSMGWELDIEHKNPWSIYSSGIVGPTGIQGVTGEKGGDGLAFVWKGNWNGYAAYPSGSSVFYNGSSYATNFPVTNTSPQFSPWFLVAQKGDAGQDAAGLAFNWQGVWDSFGTYDILDSVFYDGSSYATTGSPMPILGAPPLTDPAWFVVASKGNVGLTGPQGIGIGFSYRGEYNSANTYSSGDSVYYFGSSYGTTGSIPANFGPTGGVPWVNIAKGASPLFRWMGNWNINTIYNSGDSVYANGSAYATFLTSNQGINPSTINQTAWSLVSKKGDNGERGLIGPSGMQGTGGLAFRWKGEWNNVQGYNSGDSVFYDGSSYATNIDITGADKAYTPDNYNNWFVVARQGDPGLVFKWKGNWIDTTLYKPYDSVYYGGRSYALTTYAATGISPKNAPWFVVADKGDIDVSKNFYFGPSTISTGFAMFEEFVSAPTIITGFAWSLKSSGSSGVGFSGVIYKTTVGDVKTNLITFTIPTGQKIYWTGNLNHSINSLERVGVDISGSLTNALGLNIGVFGTAQSS